MLQPKKITKLNEHVDTFLEERPTNIYQGWRGLRRHSPLRRCVGYVNYYLCGSSRISKILAFLLQSLEQCLSQSRYWTFTERKEGEIAREQRGRKNIHSNTKTLKPFIRGEGTRALAYRAIFRFL